MPLLAAEEIGVRFGGLQALDGVNLEVEAGSITGLIGPNGAGKTTLFNVVCGLQSPTHGSVLLEGRDITRLSPARRARLGIGRTFQRLEIFGSLSVRDNVLVAAEARRDWSREMFSPGRVADEVLDRTGLRDLSSEPAGALPTGTARLVELARALATAPRVLLLDEPSSGLDESESCALGDLLTDLVADDGLGILLVEHDMAVVMRVCSEIYVLDLGAVVAAGPPLTIQSDARVRAAYLGDAVPAHL
ncbi:MAG: ABC transporter ATP-binding protein [Acidimicrobiia bacterium]|nr:ABC transporter ATP-binding protein [Acidimicrobiia bacterium]